MSKKNIIIVALQTITIIVFVLIAAGSGSNKHVTSEEAFDAGYRAGAALRSAINN